MSDRRYITGAEMAKEVRAALKAAFPVQRFSVTSKRFAGGSSVRVRWTDGPTVPLVESALGRFYCKHFDGMNDSTYYTTTQVNGETVCYASYLHTERTHSGAFLARVYAEVCAIYSVEPLPDAIAAEQPGTRISWAAYVTDHRRPIGGSDTVAELVYRHGRNRLYPEQWYDEPPAEPEVEQPTRHLRLLA